MHRIPIVLLLSLLVSLVTPLSAVADGVIIVDPPLCDPACTDPFFIADQLNVRSHRVDVAIADHVATTRIDQVFHNPNSWAAEGTYIFPIPPGATISEFTMTIDGEPIEAKLLDADEARRIYDDIVRNLRDPALLEYIGEGAIQASVFPIPPGEDRRIEIEYGEIIPNEDGLSRYRYPLNTERFSAQPLEAVSVSVDVATEVPLRAVYSPSHDVAVDRQDDFHFAAGYEDNDVRPDTDFELFWSVSPDAIGASVVSYMDDSGEGSFMLLAAPGIDDETEIVAKDVIVVLDTSGSMEGEKIVQAREALLYVLGHLNPEDRFNVVEFSTGAREYSRELMPPSEAEDAAQWVQELQATGGTDINLALLNALDMAESERPTMVLFLTDGLPTEGEIETANILENVADAAPDNVRLFAFGVGDDVDAVLLDTLSSEHQGRTTYVRPGEALNEAVSTFYSGITAPVLADLDVDVEGVDVAEIYPAPLPDLFAGTQLIALGSYEDGGPATLTLRGEVNGEPREFRYPVTFAKEGGSEFLPRLWATRKIGYLLNQIRLHGENDELVDAVVDLSLEYGIVTPYTSYLITEDDILSQEARDQAATSIQDASYAAPSSGSVAVNQAQEVQALAEADKAAPMPMATYVTEDGVEVSAAEVLRYAGTGAFVLRDDVWTDTAFNPDTMTTIDVPFASDAYFDLLSQHPGLGAAFALGQQVIVVLDEVAYRVTATS
ncbi:MAG: VWA domain-containing protein [Chloroflexota bacterium]|nr:VWA domain-containing protein [Chloroflexota bacterium]